MNNTQGQQQQCAGHHSIAQAGAGETREIAKTYFGEESVKKFLACLNSFFQNDATGSSYGIKRNSDARLVMLAFTGCGIEGIALDAQTDPSRLNEYNMIVIDSGNSHGDSWKAIFHPKQLVLNFIREDNFQDF